MLLVLAAGAAAARLHAQGQGAPAAPPRPAGAAALPRSPAACCARRRCWRTTPPGCSAAAPYLIFAATWVAAALVPTFATGLHLQLGRRPHRHHRAARLGALLPGAGRHGRRHQLRRHRLQPRDDDRLAGRAGHDHDRVHAWRCSPARPSSRAIADFMLDHASACASRSGLALVALDHRRARRERAHPGRQPGDASRAHHGARGDGARIFRPAPRHDRAGRRRSSCCSMSR